MKSVPDSVTKRVLWRYVNSILKKNNIHHYHIFSVITILFDEILKDLKSGKQLKIFNFGELVLKELPPRKYHDVNDKIVKISDAHKILRFTLATKLRNKLRDNLDINATFKDRDE